MAEPQHLPNKLASFADALEYVLHTARDLAPSAEPDACVRESRARRRDRDRPRAVVFKAYTEVFSRIPHGDPRNMLGARGRLSQDGWHVWTFQPAQGTGSLVGAFDTWDEAMTVARAAAWHLAPVDDFDLFCAVGEVTC